MWRLEAVPLVIQTPLGQAAAVCIPQFYFVFLPEKCIPDPISQFSQILVLPSNPFRIRIVPANPFRIRIVPANPFRIRIGSFQSLSGSGFHFVSAILACSGSLPSEQCCCVSEINFFGSGSDFEKGVSVPDPA
jgi:hypothetical protein